MIRPDDFPLIALGPLIYGRTKSSPILTCDDDTTARQIIGVLNTQADMEIMAMPAADWLVRH